MKNISNSHELLPVSLSAASAFHFVPQHEGFLLSLRKETFLPLTLISVAFPLLGFPHFPVFKNSLSLSRESNIIKRNSSHYHKATTLVEFRGGSNDCKINILEIQIELVIRRNSGKASTE